MDGTILLNDILNLASLEEGTYTLIFTCGGVEYGLVHIFVVDGIKQVYFEDVEGERVLVYGAEGFVYNDFRTLDLGQGLNDNISPDLYYWLLANGTVINSGENPEGDLPDTPTPPPSGGGEGEEGGEGGETPPTPDDVEPLPKLITLENLSRFKTHLDNVYAGAEDVQTALTTAQSAKSIAEGRAQSKVFSTYEDMVAWLAVPANVAGLSVGDNLYIRDVNVPDYWWDGTQAQELETEKPDLTNVLRTSDVVANVETESEVELENLKIGTDVYIIKGGADIEFADEDDIEDIFTGGGSVEGYNEVST